MIELCIILVSSHSNFIGCIKLEHKIIWSKTMTVITTVPNGQL